MAKTKAEKPQWTASAILDLLRSHHGCTGVGSRGSGGNGDRTAFLVNVASGTGYSARRYCDGLAFDLWESTGRGITGYEVKVSRSDWQKEMQDPEKADAFARYCDYWYVAAAPGIVLLEELPASWGLIEPAGSGMKIRRPAEKRKPEPFTRAMVAAIARYSVRQCPVDFGQAQALNAEFDRGHKAGCEVTQNVANRERKALEELQAEVRAFQEASGIDIRTHWRYDSKAVGKAVWLVMGGGLEAKVAAFEQLAKDARRLSEEALASVATIKALHPSEAPQA